MRGGRLGRRGTKYVEKHIIGAGRSRDRLLEMKFRKRPSKRLQRRTRTGGAERVAVRVVPATGAAETGGDVPARRILVAEGDGGTGPTLTMHGCWKRARGRDEGKGKRRKIREENKGKEGERTAMKGREMKARERNRMVK